MKTVFCLFLEMETARNAVDTLVDRKFPKGHMNIIVLAQVAKNALEPGVRGTAIPVTGSKGSVAHLDQMLSGKQPVASPGLGKIIVVGEMANMLTSAASTPPPGAQEAGMSGAFTGFGLPKPTAQKFTSGIKNGSVVFILRTEDERSSELVSILRGMDGSNMVHFVG